MEDRQNQIDLRGTQGAVIGAASVQQTYEGLKPPSMEERLAVVEQYMNQLGAAIGRMERNLEQADANANAQREAMDRSMREVVDRAVGAIRSDIDRLSNQAARLPRRRHMVFFVAWSFLLLPTPFFYSEVRDAWLLHWTAAMVLTVFAYSVSALIFGYLFGLFANQEV